MNKIITFIDICSSSRIIEDLASHNNDDLNTWHKTLQQIDCWLKAKQGVLDFIIYKFMGDGWVLIINPEVDKAELLLFYADLCDTFHNHFKKEIKPLLSQKIHPIGLTLGLDIGNIFAVKIGDNDEYMGLPLNIAARLQSCITNSNDKDDSPANQLMMIRNHCCPNVDF